MTASPAPGVLAGVGITAVIANARHWSLLIPPFSLGGGLAVAIVVGGIAGLYPAARAARLSPTEALRAL